MAKFDRPRRPVADQRWRDGVHRNTDGQDDERVDHQHAAAPGKRPATQSIHQGLDGRCQQNGQHQQKEHLLYSPQQIEREAESNEHQRRTQDLARWPAVDHYDLRLTGLRLAGVKIRHGLLRRCRLPDTHVAHVPVR